MKVHVVAGAQFGSEAKGHITHRVVKQAIQNGEEVTNIRVAGPNAGHTCYDSAGRSFALRQIPVGAVEPGVTLQIAAGSEVEVDVVLDEIDRLDDAGHSVAGRLYISPEATLINDEHKEAEAEFGMVGRIGSTGKGIGAARGERIWRHAKRVRDDRGAMALLKKAGATIADAAYGRRDTIVIEGTQGYGLGLHAGYYPQCTSSDCRAIDFLAMAGISPWEASGFQVWLVARTYPIRVAGNSGPLKDETTWEALGLPQEHTTVTKKVRRVGLWDADLVWAAIMANGPSNVNLCITMLDQMFPEVRDVEGGWDRLGVEANAWLDQVRREMNVPIPIVTTGPQTAVIL